MRLSVFSRLFCLITVLFVTACTDSVSTNTQARVLVMGDSLMAFNRPTGQSVADALQIRLGEPVIDRSELGASLRGSAQDDGIAGQYVPNAWNWVVVNGYGNDLLWTCGCRTCSNVMDRLISADGQSGTIPDMVADLRRSGAQVIYSGYLRTPGFRSPVEHCAPLGEIMDQRLAAMARAQDGVHFLSLAPIVPTGDTSYHRIDRIHPSYRGSAAIADRIAQIIRSFDRN